jgi:WD40 repeat protein
MKPQRQKRNRGLILTRQGWQKLQKAKLEWESLNTFGSKSTIEELSECAGITTATFRKVLTREVGVDKRTLVHLFMAFNLELNRDDYTKPDSNLVTPKSVPTTKRVDWGEAVDVSVFYGRTAELALLEQWLITEYCKVVALVGMGGIGKTSLALKLTYQVQGQFEYVVWRSLHNAPPLIDLLENLIQFFSHGQFLKADLPDSVDGRISQIIHYLQEYRCLIVLDNTETILQSGAFAGCYREGYEDYGYFIKRVGEVLHQSSLVLTSREKPSEVALLEGDLLAVRSLQLRGLEVVEGQKLFEVKGLYGSKSEFTKVVERYAGNALALRIVATTIKDVFNGDTSEFLKQDMVAFGDICHLLNQQFSRLSDLEKEIMYWLAINREPVLLLELHEDIVSQIPLQKLLEAIESLVRRSLIEKTTLEQELDSTPTFLKKSAATFTLQPVVLEYVTSRLVELICEEIVTQKINLFRSHALMKATAKDYVRNAQVRLILKPILNKLVSIYRNKKSLENELFQIITKLQEEFPLQPEYTAGNILNLLCQLQTNLRGCNFSYLSVWQADLRNVNLPDVNFAHANLAKSVFAATLGGVISVAFSPNGILAMGDSNGDIHLYQIADGKQVGIYKGHTNWVTSLTFTSDGNTLASSSSDHTVKLWDVTFGQCIHTLQGHDNEVWSATFSDDDEFLASASDDQTIRLWRVSTGECLKIFLGHTNWVLSVVFTPDKQTLLSGSDDNMIRLWDIRTGECLKIFRGHRDGVRSIALNPQGTILASGSDDNTIRLWNLRTGECLRIFQGHSNGILSVKFSPQGDTLASSSYDQTVRLWNVNISECLKIFQGHSNWVFSVAFSPEGDVLASGSRDQTTRLWSVSTGECLRTFQGYTNQVLSVTLSQDGQIIASGSHDQTVRLWDVSTGQVRGVLHGHTNSVDSVAFSPQDATLVSASRDKTLKLWDISTGQTLKTLQGHRAAIRSVAFSPDGQRLISGSEDKTVKLWDISTGQTLRTLLGHDAAVWSVAFSPRQEMLASGSWDQTVKLWDIKTGECLKTLKGHTSWVCAVVFSSDSNMLVSASWDQTLRLWNIKTGECLKILQLHNSWLQSVAFSPDNQTLASGSQDHTLKLWDITTGECVKTLHRHTAWIWSVAFSLNNQTLVSSSEDETIKIWDLKTSKCLKTLKTERPYERMNIVGVLGLTEATIATLKALGAVT